MITILGDTPTQIFLGTLIGWGLSFEGQQFILGLLIMIFSYWFWSEYKNKFVNKFFIFIKPFAFRVFKQ